MATQAKNDYSSMTWKIVKRPPSQLTALAETIQKLKRDQKLVVNTNGAPLENVQVLLHGYATTRKLKIHTRRTGAKTLEVWRG